jgi:hypothetical protein
MTEDELDALDPCEGFRPSLGDSYRCQCGLDKFAHRDPALRMSAE